MSSSVDYRPLLIVVSAPSGAGKTTLCDRVLDRFEQIAYSVSCTTRAPRGEEQDGRDYHFMNETDFMTRVAQGDFLEHARVHGNLYGTLSETVRSAMDRGMCVMMDIDIQGATQIRDAVALMDPTNPMRAGFVDIFISPPSMAALRDRLVGRAEDELEVIEQRLVNASAEMRGAVDYKHLIVNDDLDDAYKQFCDVVQEEWRIGQGGDS